MWVVRLYFGFDSKCRAPAVYAVLMRGGSVPICCGTCCRMGWDAQCAVARFVSAADAHNNGIVRKLWDVVLSSFQYTQSTQCCACLKRVRGAVWHVVCPRSCAQTLTFVRFCECGALRAVVMRKTCAISRHGQFVRCTPCV